MNNIFHWCLCYSGLQIMFPMQKINFIVYDQVSNGDTDMCIFKKKCALSSATFRFPFFICNLSLLTLCIVVPLYWLPFMRAIKWISDLHYGAFWLKIYKNIPFKYINATNVLPVSPIPVWEKDKLYLYNQSHHWAR